MKIFCSLTTIVCLWFIFSEVKDCTFEICSVSSESLFSQHLGEL